MAGAVTVVDHDGARARDFARRRVAMYLDVVAPLDPTVAFDPELLAALRRRVAAGDGDGAAALISDETLDLFSFSGTPAQIAEQAEALFDAGARRVEFGSPHGLDERAGVGLLAREVAPRLRTERPTNAFLTRPPTARSRATTTSSELRAGVAGRRWLLRPCPVQARAGPVPTHAPRRHVHTAARGR